MYVQDEIILVAYQEHKVREGCPTSIFHMMYLLVIG